MTDPLWQLPSRLPYPALTSDHEADVCVVGAGFAGLLTAYYLAREGKRVVVLEQGRAGGGESVRTTAHSTLVLDRGWGELAGLHGAGAARLAAESHRAAIDRLRELAVTERIACSFSTVDGYLFPSPGEPAGGLEAEAEACRGLGIAVDRLDGAALGGGFRLGPCLRFPDQAQFDPAAFLDGLAAAVVNHGGRIHEHTRVASVEGGRTARARTTAGPSVRAGAIVVATDSPFNDRIVLQTEISAHRTYVIAVPVRSGTVARALYWDMADPYHYVRLHTDLEGRDWLIVGGEDHPTGQADDGEERFARLRQWTQANFRGAGAPAKRWSGQVVEPVDGLAFIGRNPLDHPNVFVATGHSGNGTTYGAIAGLLLCDLVLGRANPWEKVYDPGRVTPGAAGTWAKRGLNAAAQYADWAVLPAGAPAEDAIPPGCGAVVQCGMKPGAVYRDESGGLHRLSPVCPHLGGIVRWNPVERSWDCPVHGSRYEAAGQAINGPAPADLSPLETPKAAPSRRRAGWLRRRWWRRRRSKGAADVRHRTQG